MKQQCLGITKNGERCKITGNLVDGYCYRHRLKTPPVDAEPLKEEPVKETPVNDPGPSASPPPAGESDSPNLLLIVGIAAFLLLLLASTLRGKRKQ